MTYVVGLTGGIGSGKSAAADRFAALGAAVIDTDAIAHRLTAGNGAAMPKILAEFGPGMVNSDGALDRAAMRRLVFDDPAARRRLEAILHPLIREDAEAKMLAASMAKAPYIMLVVPLLVETGAYRDHIRRIAVVDCAPETQIARVMQRSGLTRADVEAILAAQASRETRLAATDDIIPNDADLDSLAAKIGRLHAKYLTYAHEMA